MQDHLWELLIGAYLFAATGFAWAWALYRSLSHKLEVLWIQVMNHHEHELETLRHIAARHEETDQRGFAELQERIEKLERRS